MTPPAKRSSFAASHLSNERGTLGLRDLLQRFGVARPAEDEPAASSADLERIESELKRVPEGSASAARLYNRGGDLSLARGDAGAALLRYGHAIDTYMQAGEYDSAIAVCRKVLRLMPSVVRARCTLAWLCIGKGFLDIAREQLEAYTGAAKAAGHAPLAGQQLRLMARYVGQRQFRIFLADRLEEMGDLSGAERVRVAADEPGRPISWNPIVFAALLTADELRRAAEAGVELEAPRREDLIDRFMIHPD